MNAEHVAAVGAAVRLEGALAAAAGVPEAVDRILADAAYREAARDIADEIAALPPAEEVVGLVEAMAGRG